MKDSSATVRPHRDEAPSQKPGTQWRMDFVTGQLVAGQRIQILTIIDTVTKISPAIKIKMTFIQQDVVDVLEKLLASGTRPTAISIDRSLGAIPKTLQDWAVRNTIQLVPNRVGSPVNKSAIESFNGRLMAECLNLLAFASIQEAQSSADAWRIGYNATLPYRSSRN